MAVVTKDDVLFECYCGFSDEKKERVTEDTKFMIGSNTKILTALSD